ncbi:hypothetical protein C0Q70_08798 [Pomacea canaliculata]|uniref:Fibrinogen C-terminal domain-containing protein n=1 Tax=Pomacea canaliculata TaxID=400727 RepID=A0A2T7P7Z3_POMCA|nr:uncharacterized protein LOC112564479 [Pomacea canaliculata]PVD29547.1 hypothetical protein C0Q70_08798 [Pomacea canaliculata]
MTLSVIFFLTTAAGCVLAAQDQQSRQDVSLTELVATVESLLDRIQGLEAEKQSLEMRVECLETLCSFSDVLLPGEGTADGNEAVSLARDSQTQARAVVVRSDDSDPLIPVVTQLTERVNEVSAGLQALKSEMTEASTSVFVRWGSSTCTDSSVLVYSGGVGGSHFTSPGAAANYLCLPLSNVTLSDITVNNYAQLYGGEYETLDGHFEKDPLCAVCRSSRANNVMIPATTVCPGG